MSKVGESTLDDLEAVRSVVNALTKFPTGDQQRILRWAQEKLGLTDTTASPARQLPAAGQPQVDPHTAHHHVPPHAAGTAPDIKTFILTKNPSSDTQFAAAVAYFHRFEVPATMQKGTIAAEDLHDACRKVGRNRMPKPAQTLLNAHAQGLLDKGGERGKYTLSTVGENLVAVALPASKGTQGLRSNPKRVAKRKKPPAKKSTAKKTRR
jgi:hypothetical protein